MIISQVAHLYTGTLALSSYKNLQNLSVLNLTYKSYLFSKTVYLIETYIVKTSIYESILSKNIGLFALYNYMSYIYFVNNRVKHV